MLLTIDHVLFKVVDCTEEDVTVDFLTYGVDFDKSFEPN